MKLVGRLYEKSLWVRWRQSLPVTVTSLFSCVIDMEVSAHPQQCHPSPSPTLLHLMFQEEKAQWHKEAPALAHSFLKISKWCKWGMMEVGRENGLHIIWNKNSSPTFLQLHKTSILIVLQLDASTSTNSGPGGETVEYSVPWAESSTTASREKCRSDLLHPYWLLWKDWDFTVDYWWKCWSLQLWKRACRMKQSAPLSQSFPHCHHSGLCEYSKIHFYIFVRGHTGHQQRSGSLLASMNIAHTMHRHMQPKLQTGKRRSQSSGRGSVRRSQSLLLSFTSFVLEDAGILRKCWALPWWSHPGKGLKVGRWQSTHSLATCSKDKMSHGS